jgi:methionyl-tRNA formyltransferase
MTMADADPVKHAPKRMVLFGMDCDFTVAFLEALRTSQDAHIVAIVLARTEPSPRAAAPSCTRQFKALAGLNIVELSRKNELTSPGFLSTLEALDVDLIVVACFPWRLPSAVRALPHMASINVHPSLLPDGRGPEPIFWAFRRGLAATGVTLHLMDEGLDTGPIIEQRAITIPSDATMITLERVLARLGAEMFSDVLRAPLHSVAARPQARDVGWAAPFPQTDDLIVTTAWPATRAARFINAVGTVYGPLEVLVLANGQRLAVTEALEIENSTSAVSALQLQGEMAWIRFPDGLLHCRLQPAHQRLAFEI